MEEKSNTVFGRLPGILLGLGCTLTCLSYAWRFNRFSCKTFSWLWEENGFSAAFAEKVEWALIFFLLLSAVCIWIKKVRWLGLCGVVAMLVEMLAETFMPSTKYPSLYWAEWALRYSVPVAALLIYHTIWSKRILRLATALVFAAHGMKSLLADPIFIDFLLVFFRRIGMDVDEAHALTLLHIIGTIDLVLAAHLFFFKPERNRMVLIWMAAWGAVTALARITFGGYGNWHEVLIRTTHVFAPITLLLLNRTTRFSES